MTTFRLRLAFLIGGIVLVTSLMLWTVQNSWHRITQLENKLTGSHLESFRLADDFQQRLLRLNGAMVRFAARHEPALWAEFQQASTNLDHWIDEQNPKLTTAAERALLQEINTNYDIYLAAARRLPTNRPPVAMSNPPFVQLEDFDTQAGRLLQLGNRLTEAHRVAEEYFLTGANQSLGKLRVAFLGSLLTLVALVIGLGLVLYRDQIAPLRTQLVESQALLEQHEKLATLGTLAAGIAHEIRNPLTSVKARLYTLEKHLDSPQLARKDTEIISSEITRLERIVQNVLSFARPSEPELKTISATDPLAEVQSLMASGLQNGSVRIIVEPGPRLSIAADAEQLKQVLINLVRNAAESISGSGNVTLRVRADHVRLNGQMRDVAILEVSDTGAGIPSSIQSRLFDPFFTTKATGTGLGLSIAARIVEKHGGALQYHTQAGRGTTFGIVLPLVPSAPR